ncbi:antitoxin VapB [Halopolyspora algeriensis]|uniref:Antitoxin VapB n=1 Tax=Halopolyspora algeriensis TaxID=1500506 RepID=A0A368VEE8_9ACTN|nr:type II toxin-antitoxin system VapB family antitoxin [Halopolyspora algeriensis]RCW39528.1 antitoxin VapB [Halopolyspora algeriensis]TQM56159.1 antitoxin VapB [Halopolyspora algeriensis]
MALNIKDPATESMATEVAELAGETKTQAIRHGLEERRERLLKERSRSERGTRLARFLEYEAWPQVPADVLGQPVTRDEREEILGYGPEGV